MRLRTAVFWLLMAVGFLLAVTAFRFGVRYGGLFLLLPLFFAPFRRNKETAQAPKPLMQAKVCPQCRFETMDDATDFCPRDGTKLRWLVDAPKTEA